MTALQNFISAYRSVLPYDPSGVNPAARLTIDLAAGDEYLEALASKATSDWLPGPNAVLDYANATVPNGQPDASDAEANWQQHVSGRANATPPIPPLPPAKVTVAVRLVSGSTAQPECNNFSMSLQNSTGDFVQSIAPAWERAWDSGNARLHVLGSGGASSKHLRGRCRCRREQLQHPAAHAAAAAAIMSTTLPPLRQQQ